MMQSMLSLLTAMYLTLWIGSSEPTIEIVASVTGKKSFPFELSASVRRLPASTCRSP